MSDLHLVRGHVDAGAAQGGGWQEGRAKEENMPADNFFETSTLVLATTFPLVVRCWFFATYLPVVILTDFEAWMSDLCQGRTYYHIQHKLFRIPRPRNLECPGRLKIHHPKILYAEPIM